MTLFSFLVSFENLPSSLPFSGPPRYYEHVSPPFVKNLEKNEFIELKQTIDSVK